MITILIVEDEKPISDLIALSLSSSGYICDMAYDGMEASDKLLEKRYDLILLDIMLPEVDGYELIEFIKHMDIPVIFLSAKGRLEDKIKGFKLGADDYLTKPFEVLELLARVEAVLRRFHKVSNKVEFEDVIVDTKAHMIKKGQKEIILTEKEYRLLIFFIENKNMAMFREQIYERVWEGEYQENSRTVDLHIQRLRKKMGWEKKIVSVHKVGYRLEA
ncbi:response regulator transcription factor [Gottschalkia acidurici]|nr:response regulator transcription factor [Gottschalkia acidurici]